MTDPGARAALPLFPLPHVVFLPYTYLPLHVFEPRYRALVDEVLQTDREFAVPTLGPGWREDYLGRPPVLRRCVLGRVVHHERLDDGRFHLILHGQERIDIVSEHDSPKPFRVAATVGAPLLTGGLRELLEPLRPLVTQFARRLEGRLGREAPHEVRRLLQPALAPLEIAYLTGHLLFPGEEERRALLEADEPARLVEPLSQALVRTLGGAAPAEA